MHSLYEEILYLPHHVSRTRPQMPMSNRAAQFMPFTPLEGYDFMVSEVTRVTSERIELDEDTKNLIDLKLQVLSAKRLDAPTGRFTYFVKDLFKSGGSYVTAVGKIRTLDQSRNLIILRDGTQISVKDLLEVEYQ